MLQSSGLRGEGREGCEGSTSAFEFQSTALRSLANASSCSFFRRGLAPDDLCLCQSSLRWPCRYVHRECRLQGPQPEGSTTLMSVHRASKDRLNCHYSLKQYSKSPVKTLVILWDTPSGPHTLSTAAARRVSFEDPVKRH